MLGSASTWVLNVAEGTLGNLSDDFTEDTQQTVLGVHGKIVLRTASTGVLDVAHGTLGDLSDDLTKDAEQAVLRVHSQVMLRSSSPGARVLDITEETP